MFKQIEELSGEREVHKREKNNEREKKDKRLKRCESLTTDKTILNC